MLSIFTRDFGLVTAVAQGIRLEKSKLRYYVQNYSFAVFSLVRGKEFWRLTSAASGGDGFLDTNISAQHDLRDRLLGNSSCSRQSRSQGPSSSSPPLATQELIAKIAALLKRLLQGESPHPELFDIVHSCEIFLNGADGISEDQMRSLESLTVLRMLHSLGYVGKEDQFSGYLRSADLSLDSLDGVAGFRQLMNKHINSALKESHL
jgi:hypothetical protein